VRNPPTAPTSHPGRAPIPNVAPPPIAAPVIPPAIAPVVPAAKAVFQLVDLNLVSLSIPSTPSNTLDKSEIAPSYSLASES
jgi:hypothetical protein